MYANIATIPLQPGTTDRCLAILREAEPRLRELPGFRGWLVLSDGAATVLSLSAWQMLVGSIGLVVVALLVDEPPVQWTGGFIAALAYNAVLATGLAWILWSWIVDRLPMTVSGLSSLVIPIMGVLFAWAVLGEAPSATEWAGIALIAAALATVALSVAPRGKA